MVRLDKVGLIRYGHVTQYNSAFSSLGWTGFGEAAQSARINRWAGMDGFRHDNN